MPSEEAKILSEFLLAPAPLREVLSLKEFTDIFPSKHRSNPAIHELYRELQRLREEDVDIIRRSIAEEVKRSKQLRRDFAKARRLEDESIVAGLDPTMLEMEAEISNQKSTKPHTLDTVYASMQEASRDVSLQIAELEEKNRQALEEVQEVVSSLSDLRHGRFAQSATGEDITEELLASLKQLETSCATNSGG